MILQNAVESKQLALSWSWALERDYLCVLYYQPLILEIAL